MFHYNGFGGGEGRQKLCNFVMYRRLVVCSLMNIRDNYIFRSSDESVGQRVAMTVAGAHTFGGIDMCPMEEVTLNANDITY